MRKFCEGISVYLFTCAVLSAGVPEVLNYQGRMVNGGGLVQAATSMVFRLYAEPTGGSELYAETQQVQIVDGLYSVGIGASNATPGSLSAVFTNDFLYLEVQAGATPLLPRERVVSAGYAMTASAAAYAGSAGSSSNALYASLAGSVSGQVIVGTFTNPVPVAGTIRWTGSAFEGYDGSSWVLLSPAPSLPAPPAGMVLVPSGTYDMGLPDFPAVTTNVSAFYMDIHEVSKQRWEGVYAWATNNGYGFANAGQGKDLDHPVHTVNWYDCLKWCNARSRQEGLNPTYFTDAGFTQEFTNGQVTVYVNTNAAGYRLPTRAEWQFAARGGLSGYRFPWGDTISHARANYTASPGSPAYDISPTSGEHPDYNAGGTPYTSPVGSFSPNGYGLYDMAGNVLEWSWDSDGGGLRQRMGGRWSVGAPYIRLIDSSLGIPSLGDDHTGLRTIRSSTP